MERPFSFVSQVDAGIKEAVARAIEKHRKLGQSISIWQNGKVITLTAEQIQMNPGKPSVEENNE